MEVLSSRILLTPTDLTTSLAFYEGALGLRRYREFGTGVQVTGVVLFLGGGFLELSGRNPTPPGTLPVRLWLQVPDVDLEHERLMPLGAPVVQPPTTMPWGLREMVVTDPDGIEVVVVQVPDDHPLRRRT